MKLTITILICFTYYLSGEAQITYNRIGHYYDVDGRGIEDFYELDYEPGKSFEYICNIGPEFSRGYYYSSTGEKSEGYIRYTLNNTDFKFKPSLEEKAITIRTTQCLAFVIGVDSFATIDYNNIVSQNKMPFLSNKLFAEVIEEAGPLTFYKQFNVNSSPTETLYYVKTDSSKNYWLFPTKKTEFKEIALKIFSSSEIISERVSSGRYTADDLLNVIRLFKYETDSDLGNKIYFNSSFNEIRDSSKSAYSAKVELIEDSIYRMIYYDKNKHRIFEGGFTSFQPKIKEGEFIYYYPNQSIRKKIVFNNNKPINGITYYSNSNKHREFSFLNDVENYGFVYDIHGKQLLNENGGGEEIFYDSLNKRELVYQYVAHKLISAYFINENQIRIYQYCQNNVKIKSKEDIQKVFEDKSKYPPGLIDSNIYGIVLLKCHVDPSGKISNVKIIKGVHPDLDKLVQSFVPYLKAYNALESGKVNKEKISQEVVIPFEFSLVGFTRTNSYNSKFWTQGGVVFLREVLTKVLLR